MFSDFYLIYYDIYNSKVFYFYYLVKFFVILSGNLGNSLCYFRVI